MFAPIYPYPCYKPPTKEELEQRRQLRILRDENKVHDHIYEMDYVENEFIEKHGNVIRVSEIISFPSVGFYNIDDIPNAEVKRIEYWKPNYMSNTPKVWQRYLKRGLLEG